MRRRLGTIRAALQRPQSIAGSFHAAALGLAQTAQPLLQCEGLLVLLAWLADFLVRPTILAWDWAAAERNLRLEANSP